MKIRTGFWKFLLHCFVSNAMNTPRTEQICGRVLFVCGWPVLCVCFRVCVVEGSSYKSFVLLCSVFESFV